MRHTNTVIRRDILNCAIEHGDISPEDIKNLAKKHNFSVEHVRRTIRMFLSDGYIRRAGIVVTESGRAYLDTLKGEDSDSEAQQHRGRDE